MYANQLINEAEVQKTWGPVIEESTGITEKSKLAWMSKYCHYHNLNESVYNTVHLNPNMNVQSMGNVTLPGDPGSMNNFPGQTAGSGDRPFSLLPLAMQVAAQTVGLDLVPVVPMQGPMGVLTYLDFVYGGGRDSGAPVSSTGGVTYDTPDVAGSPLLIKVSATPAAGGATNWAVNDVIYASSSGAVATNGAAYELTFVGFSRIDGLPIFRVRSSTAAIVAATGYNGIANTFSQGAETAAEPLYSAIANGASFYRNGAAGWPAAAAGRAAVAPFGVGDQTGGIGSVTMGIAGAFGNPTGLSYVKALEDHITGFSGNAFQPANDPKSGGPAFASPMNGVDPYLRGVGESTVDNVMGLSLFNKSVAADTFQVAAAVTREQVQDLKQFGIDAVAQVEAVLVNELTQSINKYILDRIFRNGVTNNAQIATVNSTQLSEEFTNAAAVATAGLNLGPNNTTNGTVAAAGLAAFQTNVLGGGNTQGTLQRRMYTKILAASNLIATRGRRGPATFAVTGGEMATALQSVAGFVAYPLSNTVNQAGGSLYPIGAIAGVTIYVDPNRAFNDYTICVGRKGDGNSPGLVFMPYLMAESVETIAEGTMAPKIAVKSRFALVDAGFNPELMYYTMNFSFTNVSLI
jgi:hypothetical protein